VPDTGTDASQLPGDTSIDELDAVLRAAVARELLLESERVAALRGVAGALEARKAELVELAHLETAIDIPVLGVELDRSALQMRRFADLVERGEHLETRTDRPNAAPPPVGNPDLRRTAIPVGPVAVFGASNFPFAFGVSGGDTASALAAGCPVVVKAHPAHPLLSEALGDLITREMPGPGWFGLVRGVEVGRALVEDDRISAVAFTGSTAGGRALFDLVTRRAHPVPFFGELGSVNPVFVTPAAAEHADLLSAGWVESLTTRAGQMCTKPGVLVAPRGSGIVDLSADLLREVGALQMLTPAIAEGFLASVDRVAAVPGASRLVDPARAGDRGVTPALVAVNGDHALTDMAGVQTECFGPAGLVVEYADDDEAIAIAATLDGTLATSLHGSPAEGLTRALLPRLTAISGRVVWNGWPTGVAISSAQHHGGPYPATTDPARTSVGASAIQRFLRPVVYQDLPAELLPVELRNDQGE
jgi:NADP-dependent aldehyde dehydrogenase